MSKVAKLLFFILVFPLACLFHLILINYFYSSGIYVNIIYISLIWLLLLGYNQTALWLILPTAFILQPFSASPGYSLIISLFFSLAFTNWLLIKILTNRSLIMIFVSGFLGNIIFRFIFLILISLESVTLKNGILNISLKLLISYLIESTTTAVILVIIYYSSSIFLKKLNPRFIKLASANFIGPR